MLLTNLRTLSYYSTSKTGIVACLENVITLMQRKKRASRGTLFRHILKIKKFRSLELAETEGFVAFFLDLGIL